MKKLLLISLVLLCLLGFSGCSQKESNKPESTVETTPEPTPESTTETKPEEPAFSFSRGTWDAEGKVFVNESTGVRIQLGEGYSASSDADLASLYLGENVDLSSWTEEDYKTEISIPDCQFYSANGSNTAVTYENLAAEGATAIGEDTYLAIVLNNLKGQFEDLDASDVYDLTLSGQPYRAYDIKYSSNNIQIEQTMAVRKVGGYITIIVFSQIKGNDNIPEMISFFN
ncbi:MAG: hypothetical protein IKF18_03250 [Erysipelotrichaceae bacterium]|nr:hypothetical protein [Erysipelotrichaceae bacterium]